MSDNSDITLYNVLPLCPLRLGFQHGGLVLPCLLHTAIGINDGFIFLLICLSFSIFFNITHYYYDDYVHETYCRLHITT